MSDFYIPPDWLESVRGTIFFYPAALTDHRQPLKLFMDVIDEFWFADTNYPTELRMTPALKGRAGVRLISSETTGPVTAVMENRVDSTGNSYRHLLPSKLVEKYERENGTTITVVRRRGFGQIALTTEFPERSIGVFMHRGDSPGQGGSNAYFLANKRTRYEPCGNLLDKLSSRLTDRAIVITDGSNTSIGPLCRFHGSELGGPDAFNRLQMCTFNRGGFRWCCIGWLNRRYGPTLVWGLERLTYSATGERET